MTGLRHCPAVNIVHVTEHFLQSQRKLGKLRTSLVTVSPETKSSLLALTFKDVPPESHSKRFTGLLFFLQIKEVILPRAELLEGHDLIQQAKVPVNPAVYVRKSPRLVVSYRGTSSKKMESVTKGYYLDVDGGHS